MNKKVSTPLKFLISLGAPLLAGASGAAFTTSALPIWYVGLAKPALNPPSFVFGPVWTTLYVLMGVAAFLVWKKASASNNVRPALRVYFFQLVLNTAWSLVFFGLKYPLGALIVITLLWLSIVATIVSFSKISKLAAALLLPYVLWVSFASYLNYAIWMLN